MITLRDCIALCGFDEAEVSAIAEHQHVPLIIAASLANTSLKREHGIETVGHMIIEDIRAAHDRGDYRHVHELFACLQHFLSEHPEAVPGVPPVSRGA